MCERPVQAWFLGQSLIVTLRRDGASPAIKSLRFLLTRSQKKAMKRLTAARERMKVRRRAALVLAMSSVLVLCAGFFIPNPRSLWMFSRSSQWWEDVLGSFEQHDWMENFRMSRDTFQYLCDQLRPLIQKQKTHMRESVSTEHRLAITLWVLATPGEYRSVAHLFGLARCTVCQVLNETCRAIAQKLLSVYVRFPPGDSLKEVVRGFKVSLSVLAPLMVHTYQLHHLQ